MFTSTRFLTQQLGVDPGIASFFVDRSVPQDNRYWKDRLLYVARGTGFLFIPLVYDLLLRLGLDKEELLREAHVLRMEAVLDSAGKVEFDDLPGIEHVAACRAIMGSAAANTWLWDALAEYFINNEGEPTADLGKPIPPLNRADTFLFSLCDLDMDEDTTRCFIRYWYALIAAFLMMDDVIDWEKDELNGEENSVSYLGKGKDGLLKAIEMLRENFATLGAINPQLCTFFEHSLQKQVDSGTFRKILDSKNA